MSYLSRFFLAASFLLNASLSFGTTITIDFDSLALGEVLDNQYLPHALFAAPPGEERLLQGHPSTTQRVTERLRATLGMDRAICPEATAVFGFAPPDCSGILEVHFTRKATNVSFGILSDENLGGIETPPGLRAYNAWVLADVNGDGEFEMYAGVSTDGDLGTQDIVTLDGLDWWKLEPFSVVGHFNPTFLPTDGIYSLWIVSNHQPSPSVSLPADDRIEPAGLLYDDLSWTFQDAEPPRDPQNIPTMKGPGVVGDVPEPGSVSLLGMALALYLLHKRRR
jgi:hypothetical protein